MVNNWSTKLAICDTNYSYVVAAPFTENTSHDSEKPNELNRDVLLPGAASSCGRRH